MTSEIIYQKTIQEFVDVLGKCVGLMEMAKIGDMGLYDSAPVHQAKRLLAQVKGLHITKEELDGGGHVI